jgi:transposase
MKTGYWITIEADELEAFLHRVDKHRLLDEDYSMIKTVTEGYVALAEALENKEISISRLRRILFGSSTEKTSMVFGDEDAEADLDNKAKEKPRKKPKGHGRNGADKYTGARRVPLSYDELKIGEVCPCCGKGKVYKKDPHVKIWVTGSPPIAADRYEREALHCNLCGESFVAPLPEGVDDEDKYDETAVSMVAVLKYGTGMPFYRLGQLQDSMGVPLPPSTQWDLVSQAADRISPAFQELMRLAAQGNVIHNDDTSMKLLQAPEAPDGEKEVSGKKDSPRKGVFTTGIVSIVDDHQVAVYCTDHHHAGESLEELLKKRAEDLNDPIQMCDALSRNVPEGFKTVLANCLAHYPEFGFIWRDSANERAA